MPPRALHEELKRRTARPDALAAQVIKQPALLQAVFEGLEAEAARVRYGCLKVLRLVSETDPSVLYPETHRFIRLLDSDNNILKWGAILIIGNLAAVDSKGRIDCILNRYLRPINGPVLITAANVIIGAGKIARAKPHLADRIARAILQVETANYQTRECRNVASGHAITSLDAFFDRLKRPKAVEAFVRRQLRNRRNSVRQRAARFRQRHLLDT